MTSSFRELTKFSILHTRLFSTSKLIDQQFKGLYFFALVAGRDALILINKSLDLEKTVPVYLQSVIRCTTKRAKIDSDKTDQLKYCNLVKTEFKFIFF